VARVVWGAGRRQKGEAMNARQRLVPALAAAVLVAACGSPAVPPDVLDAGAHDAATADAGTVALTPAPFDARYDAHSALRNRCDRSLHLAGSEPLEPGRYPVAIFLVGTRGRHDYPGIVQNILPALARQGFVAASLEYENGELFGAAQNCNLYRDNASCMVRHERDHVAGERHSAVAQLCGRAHADCGKGVVFLGHSQGGLTALQAFRFAPVRPPAPEPMPRLVAAAPLGIGVFGFLFGQQVLDLSGCMGTASLPLAPGRLLAVNGENDAFFNGAKADQAGGQAALEAVTGRACSAPSWDCRDGSGAGWLLVKPAQLSTGTAEHEFMSVPGGSFAEPTWADERTAEPWSLSGIARWLRAQADP
jgi:hypothetical protein